MEPNTSTMGSSRSEIRVTAVCRTLRNINIVQNHTPDRTSVRNVARGHFPKVLRRRTGGAELT